MYGIGNLRLVNAHPSLLKFYDTRDHTIKTHFDWTKSGAVLRIRTMEKTYALGLENDEILNIELLKEIDILYLTPFSLGRLLLNVGVSHRIVRWLPFNGRRFLMGPVMVRISVSDTDPFIFELKGDLWKDSLSTFAISRMNGRIQVIDKGYRVL